MLFFTVTKPTVDNTTFTLQRLQPFFRELANNNYA